MNRYRQIADRLAALGVEELALQKQAKVGLSQEQKERQKVLASDLNVAQKAFETFLGEMREGFARQGAVRTVETEELGQKAMRDQQDLIKGLGNDVVLLRYYVTEDKVGILMTTAGVPLARSTKINAKELNRQIAEFRRLLRDPKANPLPIAQALYTLLILPVAHDLELSGAKTVMLSPEPPLSLSSPVESLSFGDAVSSVALSSLQAESAKALRRNRAESARMEHRGRGGVNLGVYINSRTNF